jgi:hypothetical protein
MKSKSLEKFCMNEREKVSRFNGIEMLLVENSLDGIYFERGDDCVLGGTDCSERGEKY